MPRYSTFGDEGHLSMRFDSDPGAVIEFYDAMKRSTHLQPEKRLMLALLDDALKCFQKHVGAKSGRGKRLFDEVQQWFCEREIDGIFSFEQVCATLGLSPDYVRRMLENWNAAARQSGAMKTAQAEPRGKTRKRLRYAA